jgi:hypothetical protein
MTKLLASAAAIGVAALISMGSANAAPQQDRADGMRNADQIEVSSARRHHRRYYRHYGYRHYGPRYGYSAPRYYRPYFYDSYAYSPYYSRPYYRPGPHVGFGLGGVGIGFGF